MSNLKTLRDLKMMSQEDLAGEAKIDRVTITKLERETDRPTARQSTIRKLAEALGVEVSELAYLRNGGE